MKDKMIRRVDPVEASRYALIAICICASSVSRADGFDTFSKHKDLVNHAILEIGDVEKMENSTGSSSSEFFRINSRCVQATGYSGYWGYGKKAGLLVVDTAKSVKLALLEPSLGSIKAEIKPVILVACPNSSNSAPDFDKMQRDSEKSIRDAERQLKDAERQRQELRRKWEQLRREQ